MDSLQISHASKAWTIFNIIKTLRAALPDDSPESEVPTRCLLTHVLGLTESLADALTEGMDASPKGNFTVHHAEESSRRNAHV